MQKQLCSGTITDVYNHIRNSELFRAGDSADEFEEFDLLAWFLTNYKEVGAELTTVWEDTYYYAGNHAHEEWSISIARITTPWGKCIKVVESYYDNSIYDYDSHGWERETIFMFSDKLEETQEDPGF